jgi:hypothetical protein
VQLVAEEMRRVLAFLEWKAAWWMEREEKHLDVSPDIADGISAYAAKQAHINRALADCFKRRWSSAFKTTTQDRGDEQGQDEDVSADEFTDADEIDEG